MQERQVVMCSGSAARWAKREWDRRRRVQLVTHVGPVEVDVGVEHDVPELLPAARRPVVHVRRPVRQQPRLQHQSGDDQFNHRQRITNAADSSGASIKKTKKDQGGASERGNSRWRTRSRWTAAPPAPAPARRRKARPPRRRGRRGGASSAAAAAAAAGAASSSASWRRCSCSGTEREAATTRRGRRWGAWLLPYLPAMRKRGAVALGCVTRHDARARCLVLCSCVSVRWYFFGSNYRLIRETNWSLVLVDGEELLECQCGSGASARADATRSPAALFFCQIGWWYLYRVDELDLSCFWSIGPGRLSVRSETIIKLF